MLERIFVAASLGMELHLRDIRHRRRYESLETTAGAAEGYNSRARNSLPQGCGRGIWEPSGVGYDQASSYLVFMTFNGYQSKVYGLIAADTAWQNVLSRRCRPGQPGAVRAPNNRPAH